MSLAINFAFEVVHRGDLNKKAIFNLIDNGSLVISENTKNRVAELGLTSLTDQDEPLSPGKVQSKLAGRVKELGSLVQKHIPRFHSKKEDYQLAINYLELFCLYAANVNQAFGLTPLKKYVPEIRFYGPPEMIYDKNLFKALKELEELNEILNNPEKNNKTAWNAKVKRVEHIVDNIFLNELDAIQKETLSTYLENAKKILNK